MESEIAARRNGLDGYLKNPAENGPLIVISGDYDCVKNKDFTMGWKKHFSSRIFDFTFGRLERQIPDFRERIIEIATREGVFRTLEIGANVGNSITSVYEYLKGIVPEEIPIEMTFIDIDSYANNIRQGVQTELECDSRRTKDGQYFDKFVYYDATDTREFLASLSGSEKFAMMYGYGVEFLVQDFVSNQSFDGLFRQISNSAQRILVPGAVLVFSNANPSSTSRRVGLFGEEGADYSWVPTYIEQYQPKATDSVD